MLSPNRGEFLITSHGFSVMQEQQLSNNPVINIISHYSYTKNLYIPSPLYQILKWCLQKCINKVPQFKFLVIVQTSTILIIQWLKVQIPFMSSDTYKLSTEWESTDVMQQQMITQTETWTGQMYGLDSVQRHVLLQSEFLCNNKPLIHTSKKKKCLILCSHNANCSVLQKMTHILSKF
jgi:hypothetical protein